MIRSIHLHGGLGRRFGPRFDLAVDTPAEAIRALCSMLRGFRQAVADGAYRVVRGRMGLTPEGLGLRFGAETELHIVPAAAGAKNSGAGKIIAGVVMIVAAVVTYGAAIGWFGAASASVTAAGAAGGASAASAAAWGTSVIGVSGVLSASTVGMMGLGLVFTGVTMMLAPQPKTQGPLTVDQNPSFLFTGPVNTYVQGGPVPLVYGKVRAGTVVGAASLKAEDYVANSVITTAGQTGKITAAVVGRT
jgi:predicted phage tail protein